MIELPVTHPALPSLFAAATPNRPRIDAMLAGRMPARALVDDARHPSQCVLKASVPLTFHSAAIRPDWFESTLHTLRRAGPICLVWSPAEPAVRRPPAGGALVERYEFLDEALDPAPLAALRAQLPAGCAVRELDRSLLERCLWGLLLAAYFGSLDAMLTNALGLCLLRGDEILCETYAPFLGAGAAELGVITPEPHRGRNYAAITSAFLVALCLARGYRPYWTCDADNLASARVAAKLGFCRRASYQMIQYPRLEPKLEDA